MSTTGNTNTGSSAIEGWIYVLELDAYYDIQRQKMYTSKQANMLLTTSLARTDPNIKKMTDYHRTHFDLFQTADRVDYAPGKEHFYQSNGDTFLNLYTPSPLVEKEGHPDWFFEHLAYLFPDIETRNHILNYMAHLVQFPQTKIRHNILMTGMPGTGKSSIVRVIEKIVGSHNLTKAKTEKLVRNFNSFAKNSRVIEIGELKGEKFVELENMLKDIATEDSITIEEKYQTEYLQNNYAHIIATSNDDCPLRISQDDRRWFVATSNAIPKSGDYYTSLFEKIEANTGEVLYYLKRRDISTFNASAPPPVTTDKLRLIETSRSDIDRAIEDVLALYPCRFITMEYIVEQVFNLERQNPSSKRISNILKSKQAVMLPPIKIDNKTTRVWMLSNTDLYQGKDIKNMESWPQLRSEAKADLDRFRSGFWSDLLA